MNPSIILTSVTSYVDLPVRELENAANKYAYHKNLSAEEDLNLSGYENISWRFLNTTVKGNVQLVFANAYNSKVICIDVPTKTHFIAACTNANKEKFELEFGISLS